MRKILVLAGAVVALVVLAISFKVVAGLGAKARTADFGEDVENLFAGLQQYREVVGSFPMGSNAQIAKALMGQNPKKLIILVNRKTELNEKGEFVDPWGTALRIYYYHAGVMVRSAGPNRRFDDGAGAESDDYFLSN